MLICDRGKQGRGGGCAYCSEQATWNCERKCPQRTLLGWHRVKPEGCEEVFLLWEKQRQRWPAWDGIWETAREAAVVWHADPCCVSFPLRWELWASGCGPADCVALIYLAAGWLWPLGWMVYAVTHMAFLVLLAVGHGNKVRHKDSSLGRCGSSNDLFMDLKVISKMPTYQFLSSYFVFVKQESWNQL